MRLYDWASAPDSAGQLTVHPRPLAWLKGGKGKGWEGMGKGTEEGSGGTGEGKGRNDFVPALKSTKICMSSYTHDRAFKVQIPKYSGSVLTEV